MNPYIVMKRIKKVLFVSLLIPSIIVAAVFSALPQDAFAATEYLSMYSVRVQSGYLALRNGRSKDPKNEIGKLDTGDLVVECPTNTDESTYKYVYSLKLRKYGYVNRNYLEYYGVYTGETLYVKVEKNYLALRNAKATERANEIGELYTGQPVVVLDDTDPKFWTVYSPDLRQTGYVNRNYLVRNNSYRAEDDSAFPLGFPSVSYGEWSVTSDNYLRMRVELKNLSRSKTIIEYTIQTSAQDANGDYVADFYWLKEETDYNTLKPGEVKFTDYFYLPSGNSIRNVWVEIKSVRLSDGTYIDLSGGSSLPYSQWTIQ